MKLDPRTSACAALQACYRSPPRRRERIAARSPRTGWTT